MRNFLIIVISLVGCGFGDGSTTINRKSIKTLNNTQNVYIYANLKGDSSIVKLIYLNTKWENIEINLTPEKKDCVVPCDSIVLIKAYFGSRSKYVKDILAYTGDSIEISDSGIHRFYSKKSNLTQWVTLNEFYDFYSTQYPFIPKKIDSLTNYIPGLEPWTTIF